MNPTRSIAFANDGTWAAIANREGIELLDIAGSRPTIAIPTAPARDVVAVGTGIWLATTTPELVKLERDGTASSSPLRNARGMLRPYATGALWTGDDDTVIPISAARQLVCRGDRAVLRDPGTERWNIALRGRVCDGAVLFGGRTIALCVASGAALSQLVVLGERDGALHHRITLAGIDMVRFAPGRGYAVMRSERRLILVDLRFGAVVAEHVVDRTIADFALDDAGNSFIIRDDDSAMLGSIRAWLDQPRTTVALAPPPPAPAPEPPPPAQVTRPFHQGSRSLPMPCGFTVARETALAAGDQLLDMLEQQRALVAGLAGVAIARAWDDGRLSLPAEPGSLPFKTEVDALLLGASGRADAELEIATARVELADRLVLAAATALGETSPLTSLAAQFELSELAQLVLLVIAAPSLWGELARLYGILANDPARPLVDELLVSQILESHGTRYEIADELDRLAPLVRNGVITAGRGKRPFAALACEPLVLRMLRGADVEADLEYSTVVPSAVAFEDLLVPAAVKDELAARLADSNATRLVVRGRRGSGRHAMLATIAAVTGRWLVAIDAAAIVRGGDLDSLRVALVRAHLLDMLPCVDGLEALPSNETALRENVRKILDEHQGPLAVRLPPGSEVPLAPGHLAVELPSLAMDERVAAWHVLLDAHQLAVREVEELADRFRVGPGVIARVCASVHAEPGTDAGLALETAIRGFLDTELRATATRVERLTSWSRVILPPDIQQSVLELIARIKHRRTVYDTWGMGEVLATARGVTALFQGGPGTGKTLVASAIANELGMDLYRVDLSRIMSKWIGETEQNLARLFDAAEDGHAILLFDEADSLFGKRTEVKSSVDRYANLEVNFLLQRLDTFEGIAILTTNFGTAIDRAFKRRLSLRLTLPFPDEEAREELWRAHLPATLPRSGELDLGALARKFQLSGGYIRNAVVRAAFLAAEERTALSQDHLERALKAEFREVGKIAETGVLE